jgi:hypothetical protein
MNNYNFEDSISTNDIFHQFLYFPSEKNISEKYKFFEDFSIPKNNIISVKLALFGRDGLSYKLINEVKIMANLINPTFIAKD